MSVAGWYSYDGYTHLWFVTLVNQQVMTNVLSELLSYADVGQCKLTVLVVTYHPNELKVIR